MKEGAPFALRAALARVDAEPWAPGPAMLRATVPLGAPDRRSVGRRRDAHPCGGADRAGRGLRRRAVLARHRGAGSALVLFSRPPTAAATPAPAPLAGDELRLPLAALATAGGAGRLRWTARSSDESGASARIEGGELVVEPALGAEGTVRIEATATDADGQSVTVVFNVQVEFHWPRAVWRNAILAD